MVACRLRLAALGLAALLFGGCEGGSYAVSIEYDWGSMTVSAWDADVPGCAALFPREAGTRFAEEPPIPPACLEAIDEIVVQLPGWTETISVDPRLDLSTQSWGALDTGSTVVVSIVGRYGTRDVFVRVPEPRPELTGEVEIDELTAAATWPEPPATLACLYVDALGQGGWSCEPDVGRIAIPRFVDRDTLFIKRLWHQPSQPDATLWERQWVWLKPGSM